MKIVFIILFRHLGSEKQPIKLASVQDLSSFNFFYRSSVAEHLRFGTRTVIQRTPPGTLQTVELKKELGFVCHAYHRMDGLSGCVVTDYEYPQRIAISLLKKIMDEFEKQTGDKWKVVEADQNLEPAFMASDMAEYQNPTQADKIARIQKYLDEIKEIMHKNIEEVLKRGETLESLMEKSEDLSASSKIFYKKAKETNRCCVIL